MNLRNSHGPGGALAQEDLSRWFEDEPGCLIAESEIQLLNRALPDLFGYHIVQLGDLYRGRDLLASSRISHKLVINFAPEQPAQPSLVCAEYALPLASNAIDVLVLPHVLEFATDPRRVLREAERVLIGEGHLVLLAFNRWSWFGLTSALRGWLAQPPWNGRYLAAAKINDWLQLLGFDIVEVARAGYRPPSSRTGLNRRLAFVEKLGAVCWPVFGNVYLIVAKKRVEGMTPLKTIWRHRRRVVAGSVAEPSARGRADRQ